MPVPRLLATLVASALLAATAAVEVRLDWSDNAESDLAHYRVYRSTSSGSLGSRVADQLAASAWVDRSVQAASTYYYRVSAVDRSGNESPPSSQVMAQIPAAPEPPPPSSSESFQEAGGLVVMEAEHFTASDAHGDAVLWRPASALAGFVGAGYVETPDNGSANPGWASAAELSYALTIASGGSYQIWLRREARDAAANSLWVGADGAQIGSTVDNGGGSGWTWVRHGSAVDLAVGAHVFQLRRREDGYRVDRILLCRDSAYVPAGNGPAESARGGLEEPPPSSGGLISGIQVASGRAYQLARLEPGSALYIDRSYAVGSLPAAWTGAEQIRTANDDKNATGGDFLRFQLAAAATVHVAFDSRASGRPSWLQQWTDTGSSIATDDVPFRVFAKSFAAGGVVLGGNADGVAPGSMYWVFAVADTAPPPADPDGFALRISFQPASAPTLSGWAVDSGAVFGDRADGQRYGWDLANDSTRDRNAHADQTLDTLIHLQKDGNRRWEIALPNGIYQVRVVAGDPSYSNQLNHLLLEGQSLADPDGQDHFDEFQTIVEVSDGRLTLSPAAAASNAKLCLIEIASAGTAN